MATQRGPKKRGKNNEPRKLPRSFKDLDLQVGLVRAMAGRLSAQAQAVDKIGQIEVDGVQKFARGMKLLRDYITAVEKGVVARKAELE